MKRFPLRTLLLMIVALVAFVRFWRATHPKAPLRPAGAIEVRTFGSLPTPDGG